MTQPLQSNTLGGDGFGRNPSFRGAWADPIDPGGLKLHNYIFNILATLLPIACCELAQTKSNKF